MENLVYLAPVLGCLAMAAVMLFMMRGHTGSGQQSLATDAEIAQLRAEIAALKAEQAIAAYQNDPGAPTPADPGQR